jgi:replicative DNA helicase
MSDEYFDDLKRTHRQTAIDRLPPHSLQAEQGVLGCILLDPESMVTCIERLQVQGQEFYDLRHQTIYGVLLELYDDRVPIDVINLVERLKLWDQLEQVGSINYLSALPDVVPSAENLPSYIDIVLEKYALRRMIRVCTEGVGKCFEQKSPVDVLLAQVEHDVLSVSESRIEPVNHSMHALVSESLHLIEEIHLNQGIITGLATGFADLDKMLNGLQKGEMVVLAGRPSTGKTALAMNIVDHVSVTNHLPVGVMSLEMTARSLVMRMICSRARVNIRNVNEGFLATQDFPKITTAAGQLHTAPIFIDDTGGLSVMQIRAKLRRMKQRHDIKIGVVDYMQLANAPGSHSREDEVGQISTGLKNLAKELDIPILVLCQMNRSIEHEKNRRPRLSDLRESGRIEQDADVVLMLYNVKNPYDEDESEYQDARPVNCLIAKQRNGPTGDVRLTFLRNLTRFETAAKVSDEDVEAEAQPALPHAND